MGVRPLAVAFLGRDSAIPEQAKMALAAPSVQVGGTTNHVHVLFLLGKQVNLSEIVRPVGSKRQSRTVQQALAEQRIDLRSSSSSLGRVEANFTLLSLVRRFKRRPGAAAWPREPSTDARVRGETKLAWTIPNEKEENQRLTRPGTPLAR